MNLRNLLLREAGKLASSQTVRRIQLFAEIGRLEGRRSLSEADASALARLREEAENCAQALPRFAEYRPYQVAEPICPQCWVVGGESIPLLAGSRAEGYQCGKCRSEYP